MEKIQKKISAEQYIIALIDTLEEHTSYAHPHAAGRIAIAGQQLLTCYTPLVRASWAQSTATANAKLILSKTKALVEKHQNSSLGQPAQLLHNHALSIYKAIQTVDQQIQNMPPCDNQICMVASTKNESLIDTLT